MKNIDKQILKNQASIIMALTGILDHLKVDDLDYVIALRDRMKETKDAILGADE